LATLSLPSITNFRLWKLPVDADDLRKFITRHKDTIKTVEFGELDLTTPSSGAWSSLLSSLTSLKDDVELIRIRKPIKRGYFVTFEPENRFDSTFGRYVWYDEYDCDCHDCLLPSPFAWSSREYRLGTRAKKEDWTRGLELMIAGSRICLRNGDVIRDP